MKIQVFEIELKQPVIVSQQAATVGAHQSLDYIAGSTLLGLAAAKLYASLSSDDAFLLFHSGWVQFLDALPVIEQEISYPVPLSLHAFKGEKYVDQSQVIAEKIFDVSQKELKGKQPVQLRNFYLTLSGKKVTPSKQQMLKTAIDSHQNRAAESQLFSYEALTAGQTFRFAVRADPRVSDELWQKLIASLTGIAHLGRSRSAQFGRVEIHRTAQDYVKQRKLETKKLKLWLLSDLYLHGEGMNTLNPSPKNLGLANSLELIIEQSFIRSRRYSAYNAYRKHYDKERQVICRGSVLCYAVPEDFNDYKTLEQKLTQGLGLYTENGLGQVLVNPELLQDTHPHWETAHVRSTQSKRSPERPASILIDHLFKRISKQQYGSSPHRIAEQIFYALCEKVRFSRLYYGMESGVAFDTGMIPSKTQFGRFKFLANQHRNDPKVLWDELTNSKNGMLFIRSEDNESNRQRGASYLRAGWQLKYGVKVHETLADFLIERLKEYSNEANFTNIVAELAVLGLSDQWEKCCIGDEQSEGALV